MASMGYMIFEITLGELSECAERMDRHVSEREHQCRQELVKLCREIIDNLDSDLVEGDWDGDAYWRTQEG